MMFLEPCQGFQNGFEHIFFRILRILYLTFCYSAALFSPVFVIFSCLFPAVARNVAGGKAAPGEADAPGGKSEIVRKLLPGMRFSRKFTKKALTFFAPATIIICVISCEC